jgi:RecA-family ATPase
MTQVIDKPLEEQVLDFERARRQAKRILDAEDQGPREPLQVFSIEQLMARPAQSYLIDQWVLQSGLTQVVGAPGTLKSFIAMSAGLSIAAGLNDFFGYAILHHGAVLYIAAEGGWMFQYRILAWCDEHGVDETEIPFRVIPMPVNLRDPEYQKELLAIIEDIKPVLVVVDTLSRCTPGAEENSARDMGEVVSFCTADTRRGLPGVRG